MVRTVIKCRRHVVSRPSIDTAAEERDPDNFDPATNIRSTLPYVSVSLSQY